MLTCHGSLMARTKITKNQASPRPSADPGAASLCTGHVAAGAQSELIWVHRLVIAEVPRNRADQADIACRATSSYDRL